ncbi:retrovirus-related pol polyprotein from transposon TNT 1-94 [Tanacetum coccineum]|uniref:Retrovirus-related pol polyprotein from transposon TNT 1-94 n=1 Tax=Tanacetum coccineum TaxID=301880 RepID=A0ABQ4XKR5_9ASTR
MSTSSRSLEDTKPASVYKDRSKSRPQGSNPRDTFNYCKEEGHWKFNYPKLKEKGQVVAVAKDDSGSEHDVVLSVVDYKGVLDLKGFKYTSKYGLLHVSKGSLVAMKTSKDYLKLCVFGCPTYYHVSEGKLDLRGKKYIFMGYGNGVKGYRIWSPSERRVILSRFVTLDEDYLFREDPIESKLEDEFYEKGRGCPTGGDVILVDTKRRCYFYSTIKPNSPHIVNYEQDSTSRLRVGTIRCKTASSSADDLEEEIYMSQLKASLYKEKKTTFVSLIYSTIILIDDMLVAAKDIEEVKTSDVGLIYGGDREYLVVGYSDSDFAANLDSRRSLIGYVFTIGNSVVSWKAKLQPSVALSTSESDCT